MRLGPPPEVPEIPGQFWIDFIRDTAPVFRKPTIEQLGEFIAPDVPGPHRRREVRPAPPRGDHRRARAGRHRRGQRRQLPGDHVHAPPVGPPAVLQSRGDQGPARRTVLVRLRGRGPERLARLPRGGRSDAPRDVDRLRRLLPRRGCGRPRVDEHRPRLHAREPVPQRVLVPGRGGLHPIGCARPDVAPAGLDGPRGGHDVGAARRAREPRRGADLPQPRQPRVRGRRPDAAARGPARADGPPRDRVQGAARRRDHAPRQHDRRGVPPAAGDPPAWSTS